MLSHKQLMKHLRDKHNIEIKSNQSQALRNIGYYHGYKEYRFIRDSKNKINFTSFDQIIALNKFDLELKALLYPKIMFIENALKSYVLESILKDSESEYLDDIFARSLTDYKNANLGSKSHKDKIKIRIKLKNNINSSILRDYSNNKLIINHFLESNRKVPIWAVFESISLGEFAIFFDCCNQNVKENASKLLNLPTNFNSNGELMKCLIYSLVDIRNAIAHNSQVYDARFQTMGINKLLIECLKQELDIKSIEFKNIVDYVILIIYILLKMKVSKTECNKVINDFINLTEYLKKNGPNNLYNQLFSTQFYNKMIKLKNFVKRS